MNEQVFFRNELSDLEAYFDFYLQTPEGKRYRRSLFLWGQGILLFVIFAAAAIVRLLGGSLYDAAAIGVVVFLAVEFFLLWRGDLKPAVFQAREVFRKQIRRWTEREKSLFLISKECRIAPEGLVIRSDAAEHFWKWEAVDRVASVSDFLFIQIGQAVYVVPQRAFEAPHEFERFAQAMGEFHRAGRETPVSLEKPQIVKRPLLRLPKALTRILLIAVFLLLCFGAAFALDFLFSSELPLLPQSSQIRETLDGYMRAMQNRDVGLALSYFYEPSEEWRLFLLEQLEGGNYALYDGYQRFEITNWYVNYNTPWATANVPAVIAYQSDFAGVLIADMETKDGMWKIVKISVYAPPAKIERFLAGTR